MSRCSTPRPRCLKRMKRGGGADVFLRSIAKMRRTIPDLTLRTSFIVGFPGETEKEFEELCDFVREAQFDWMGAFAYSDQDGAGAYRPGQEALAARDRAPPQAPDGDPAPDQQEEKEGAGRTRIRSAARRRIGRNRTAARRPHPHARTRDRRQSLRQRLPRGDRRRSPASSTAARSPKRTTTIWSPRLCSRSRMPRKRNPCKLRCCPICKKAVKSTDPDFPFCSDRCRIIDLGKWASGAYVISSPVTDAEEPIRDSNPEDPEDECVNCRQPTARPPRARCGRR